MAKLIHQDRKSSVLTKIALPCTSRYYSYYNVNITAGCVFGCIYCYAQGYKSNPKNGNITFYNNSFEKLKTELPRKRVIPQEICFSSSCEPFAPFAIALQEFYKILNLLLLNGINIYITTKGLIPARFIQLFSDYSGLVHFQVGITTLDDRIRKIFEPNAVPVKYRLRNIERLISVGVYTEARLDPLIPGITDEENSIKDLFKALADVGLRDAIASYLFLRWSNRNQLKKAYSSFNVDMDQYYKGDNIRYCQGGEVEITTKNYRGQKYETIISVAKSYGIKIKLCSCRNPDLTDQVCHPQGKERKTTKQLTLFQM